MAVYRVDSLQTTDANTIDTYLLLECELKGRIEDPQYYFANTEQQTLAALDDLMLTNGWRRFKWENVLKIQNLFLLMCRNLTGILLPVK